MTAGFTEHQVKLDHRPEVGGYIVGILTVPSEEVVPSSHPGRVVLIAHGLGGHKDYCYQKVLGRRLAADGGLYTFRFDFRGCGDSSDQPDQEAGRTIARDVEDISLAVEFAIGERGLMLAGVVGHSRGLGALLKWTLENQGRIRVPTIVNCAGRHRMAGLMESLQAKNPNLQKEGGQYLRAYRNGAMRDNWIPLAETQSVSSMDMSDIPNLDGLTSVYSIYGLRDHIVPIQDAARYANDLKERHVLEFIERADHNYYSKVTDDDKEYIETLKAQQAQNKPSSQEVTVPELDERKNRLNYNPIVADKIVRWFQAETERTRFLSLSRYAHKTPRWKNVDGIANFRDLGGFHSTESSNNNNKLRTGGLRPGLVFRCANTSTVTDKGVQELQQLGIKTVFDLRSESERERVGTARIPGLEVRWTPVFHNQDSSPAALAKRYSHFFDPTSGFESAYREILSKAGPAYRQIFLHLRDRPNDGIIVHCTAGKDRTGVLCALILSFMGVDKDTVAREYELTTSGMAGEIERIMRAIDRETPSETEREGIAHMLTSKYDSMLRALYMLDREFGGPDQYLKEYCHLTDGDLRVIRGHLAHNPAAIKSVL